MCCPQPVRTNKMGTWEAMDHGAAGASATACLHSMAPDQRLKQAPPLLQVPGGPLLQREGASLGNLSGEQCGGSWASLEDSRNARQRREAQGPEPGGKAESSSWVKDGNRGREESVEGIPKGLWVRVKRKEACVVKCTTDFRRQTVILWVPSFPLGNLIPLPGMRKLSLLTVICSTHVLET